MSGAEPTLCPSHLLGVLDLVHSDRNPFDLFVIESNGVVFSQDKDLVRNLEDILLQMVILSDM